MQTSAKGIALIESHEGVVLKAYRCPANVLTIGAGLTAASGVVKPTVGMKITREEASQLLAKALRRNYEPGVAKAMPNAASHEFDAGVSFHYNTGAIGSASWVKAWSKRDWPKVQSGMAAWRKGGGKVLPGLVRRREEEFNVLRHNRWPASLKVATEPVPASSGHAGIVISLSDAEIENIRAAFTQLGYDAGRVAGKVRFEAVTSFQEKHGLTVDGLIGRATLSTLQRELDARAKAKTGAVGIAGGGAVAGGNEAIVPADAAIGDTALTWLGGAVLVAGLVYGVYLAWQYRDVIAARMDDRAPRLAAWLRSF